MKRFENIYVNKSVLVTGDSGFKGSWLSLWLQSLGAAQVTGLSLPPETSPNHSDLLDLDHVKYRGDITELDWVVDCLTKSKPEIVFHLAAQALVRRSYRDPVRTWQSNVMGTVNLLEACRRVDSVRAIVLITTDKVYKNNEWCWGYRESDRLGGHDPYSASKACCELAIESYRSAFFNTTSPTPLLASVRAGNVIGGGDWAQDRLIPDIARATTAAQPLEIRSPNATRPWQHVLECLTGYLMIGQRLLKREEQFGTKWNIGPSPSDNRQVIEVLHAMQQHWPEMAWTTTSQPQPHEANLLYLDSSKARAELGWKPVWDLAIALEKTATWYRTFSETRQVLSEQQLREYEMAASESNCNWISTN